MLHECPSLSISALRILFYYLLPSAFCFLLPVRAQTPATAKEPATLEEMVRQPHSGASPDKIAPTMGGLPAYATHTEMLKRLYPAEVMDPLGDHFDRTVPGGFPAALARARLAGVPDALLAEIESMRAMFDVNYPALVATMPRLRTSWQHWDEKASLFPTHKEFEIYLKMVFGTVEAERTTPGSFAQMAMRLRKRDIAREVYKDLRQVDGCSDQYAILHDPRPGAVIPVDGWMSYVNPKSHLAINKGADVTGQPFGPQRACEPPAVPAATYKGGSRRGARRFLEAIPDSGGGDGTAVSGAAVAGSGADFNAETRRRRRLAEEKKRKGSVGRFLSSLRSSSASLRVLRVSALNFALHSADPAPPATLLAPARARFYVAAISHGHFS